MRRGGVLEGEGVARGTVAVVERLKKGGVGPLPPVSFTFVCRRTGVTERHTDLALL